MSTQLRAWIEWIAQAIEILAVGIMVAFVLVGTVRWLVHMSRDIAPAYQNYRVTLGKSLLLGLELLVAADIIRTVTLDATLASIAALGALVVVRTALSWTLTVEVEGHWPWQAQSPQRSAAERENALAEGRSPQ